MLKVEHADPDLQRVELEAEYSAGLAVPVVKQFRILMQTIRCVSGKAALYQFRGRRLEKLKGGRQHQHSMRLNRKFRLIVEFSGDERKETILIVGIENHYGG